MTKHLSFGMSTSPQYTKFLGAQGVKLVYIPGVSLATQVIFDLGYLIYFVQQVFLLNFGTSLDLVYLVYLCPAQISLHLKFCQWLL